MANGRLPKRVKSNKMNRKLQGLRVDLHNCFDLKVHLYLIIKLNNKFIKQNGMF